MNKVYTNYIQPVVTKLPKWEDKEKLPVKVKAQVLEGYESLKGRISKELTVKRVALAVGALSIFVFGSIVVGPVISTALIALLAFSYLREETKEQVTAPEAPVVVEVPTAPVAPPAPVMAEDPKVEEKPKPALPFSSTDLQEVKLNKLKDSNEIATQENTLANCLANAILSRRQYIRG